MRNGHWHSRALRWRFCGAAPDGGLLAPSSAAVQHWLPAPAARAASLASPGRREQPSIVFQNVQTVAAPVMVMRQSPGLAVILSFFFAGLGQFYNGHVGKVLLFMAGR